MHDALRSGLCRRPHHGNGSVNVGPQHRVRIGDPDAIVGGNMEDIPTSSDRPSSEFQGR